MVAEFDDLKALELFADGLDVATYEFENIPVESVRFLSERMKVFPPPTHWTGGRTGCSKKFLSATRNSNGALQRGQI